MRLTIPSVEEVDFANPQEVEGYGHLLASAFRNSGGFATHPRPSHELVTIRRNAEKWIYGVETIMSAGSFDRSRRILTWYDIVHRIAFGCPADKKYFSPRLNLPSTPLTDRFSRLADRLDLNPQYLPPPVPRNIFN